MQFYGVTGMPLAGKTTVAGLMEQKGFEVVDMGDVVRKEMEKRKVPTEKTGYWVNKQREENGMNAIAELTIPYIEEKNADKIVITGMRGLEERKKFEKEFGPLDTIGVWASPETRRKRKRERMREEDVEGDGFKERDIRELENGVGRLMALSNYMIINEGLSIEELEEEVNQIVK